MANRHPLNWPSGQPRTERRESLKRFMDYPTTSRNVERALSLFEYDSKILVTNVLVTSNYTPADKKPEDPGVAVYFTWDGRQHVIAADRFERPESNLVSVLYIVQARRTEMRLGSLTLLRQSLAGFLSLPVPMAERHWSEVLGVARKAAVDEIERAYRLRAKQAHPDSGGNVIDMQVLNRAREAALKDILQENPK